MDYFNEYSEERPVQFRAGEADFAPRNQQAPWHEDPRAMFRTVAGLAGAPGLAQAGMGMLGGLARAVDPAERVFRAAAGSGMLGLGGAANAQMSGQESPAELEAELEAIEQARANAPNMNPQRLKAMHERRIYILNKLGRPVQYQRSLQPRASAGMLEQLASRPSGAGARRDKKLREAEERDTRTG